MKVTHTYYKCDACGKTAEETGGGWIPVSWFTFSTPHSQLMGNGDGPQTQWLEGEFCSVECVSNFVHKLALVIGHGIG